MTRCQTCNFDFAHDFCPKCGAAAAAVGAPAKEYRVCVNCGQGLTNEDKFCGGCGTNAQQAQLIASSAIDSAIQSVAIQVYNQTSFAQRARLLSGGLFIATGLVGFLLPALWTITTISAIAFLFYTGRVEDARNKGKPVDQSTDTKP